MHLGQDEAETTQVLKSVVAQVATQLPIVGVLSCVSLRSLLKTSCFQQPAPSFSAAYRICDNSRLQVKRFARRDAAPARLCHAPWLVGNEVPGQ